jgi:hypothetical protein
MGNMAPKQKRKESVFMDKKWKKPHTESYASSCEELAKAVENALNGSK